MNEQFIQYGEWALWAIFVSGFVLEITPIKWNPLSSTLAFIGGKLNKNLQKNIVTLQQDVKTVKNDFQEHTIESQRRDILDFADCLMHGYKKTRENFDYIIRIHDKYKRFIEDNNKENGQVDLAFEFIAEKFKEFRDTNGFL